jgi:Tol biopolymer transport system component
MPDVQEVFRMATQKVLPDPGALERQNRNQRRRSTQRKAGAYGLVAVIVVIGLIATFAALGSNGKKKPTSPPTPTVVLPLLARQRPVIVGLDGSVQRELTGLPEDAYGLALSRDGQRVAFVTNQNGTNRIGWIGIDGHGLQILTSAPPTVPISVSGSTPAWSPEGGLLAYTGVAQGNVEIIVTDSYGFQVMRVTTDPAVDESPSWGPGGSIVYDNGGAVPLGDGGSPTAEIYAVPTEPIPARGGHEKLYPPLSPSRLTRNGQSDFEPNLSPDGTRITFVREGNIWVMDADGSNARELVSLGDSFVPRWSPDGTRIAFATCCELSRAKLDMSGVIADWPVLSVHIVDVATGGITDVGRAAVATFANPPQWLPSGDALLLNLVEQT